MTPRDRAAQIIELRRVALNYEDWIVRAEQAIIAAVEEDRELCAVTCEKLGQDHVPTGSSEGYEYVCADAIRAR